MTRDAIQIITTMFAQSWRFFNSWCFPGTNVTPAAMFLLLIVSGLILRFVLSIISSARVDSHYFVSKHSNDGGDAKGI